MIGMTKSREAIISEGKNARKFELHKEACPYGMTKMRLKHLWLAGWHDADMTLSRRGNE